MNQLRNMEAKMNPLKESWTAQGPQYKEADCLQWQTMILNAMNPLLHVSRKFSIIVELMVM